MNKMSQMQVQNLGLAFIIIKWMNNGQDSYAYQYLYYNLDLAVLVVLGIQVSDQYILDIILIILLYDCNYFIVETTSNHGRGTNSFTDDLTCPLFVYIIL